MQLLAPAEGGGNNCKGGFGGILKCSDREELPVGQGEYSPETGSNAPLPLQA